MAVSKAQRQAAARAEKRAAAANRSSIPTTPPPGTVKIIGSQNGTGVAYDAAGNALGIVQASLRQGATVFYSGGSSPTPTAIQGVGMEAPTQDFFGNPFNPAGTTTTNTDPPKPAFDGYAPDSFYNDAIAQIAARRQMALNAATEGERSLSNDYGLGIKQDGSGATYTGQWAASDKNQLGIDPSNPFSRASLLNKSYFVSGKVGEGSYANRGLLTSGAYQRSQARDSFRFEGGKDSLLKSFASQLQDYRQRRAQAEADARAAQSQASYDLFQRNRDNYDRMYGV